MKNLFQVTILATFLLFSFSTAYTQTITAKAGLNLSTFQDGDDDFDYADEFDYQLKPGFHIGATAEFPISDAIGIEGGLLLSTKGTTYEIDLWGETFEARTHFLYIDIPVTAKGYFDLGGVKGYAAAGPYLGIGISGKSSLNDETEDIEFGSDEGDTKRTDLGLVFGAGVEFSNVVVGLSYNLGLANIVNIDDNDNGYHMRNRVLQFTVGYKFAAAE